MTAASPVSSINDIPGWFSWTDQQLFRYFLGQATQEARGDLVELGTYLGKSAALIGEYVRPGERFVVCDLFNDVSDTANELENSRSYSRLTRQAFEENYQALRGNLPQIIQGPSSLITEYVTPRSARFVHVDASHLYEHVATDIDSAITMLAEQGIVVFDDYRSRHTPGVAAAVWGAVAEGRLRPVCLSGAKFYAVVSDSELVTSNLKDWLSRFGRLQWEVQEIAQREVVRVWPPSGPKANDRAITAEVRSLLAPLNKRLARIEREVKRQRAPFTSRLGSAIHRIVGQTSQR